MLRDLITNYKGLEFKKKMKNAKVCKHCKPDILVAQHKLSTLDDRIPNSWVCNCNNFHWMKNRFCLKFVLNKALANSIFHPVFLNAAPNLNLRAHNQIENSLHKELHINNKTCGRSPN